MDDLGGDTTGTKQSVSNSLDTNGWRRPEKILFKFFDMHGDMELLIFEPYMEENILPKNGLSLVSFNAHIDKIVPEDMQLRLLVTPPSDEKHLFDDFGIETWIHAAAEKGYLKNIIWIKPPWTKGVQDGSRVVQVSSENNTTHDVSLEMKTLCSSIFEDVEEDYDGFKKMFSRLRPEDPYILDFELSFFTCDNSFTNEYENCPTYYPLFKELFKITPPASMNPDDIKVVYLQREKELKEIDEICQYLHKNRTMPSIEGEPTEIYRKISEIREELLKFYEDSKIDWKNIYAAGLVCNEFELPIHYTKRDDIVKMVNDCVSKVVDLLPGPPVLITVAVMFEYMRFSPEEDLDFTIDLIQKLFKQKYANIDSPEFIGY